MPRLEQLYRTGCRSLEDIQTNANYQPVLVNLPKAQIIVLIFAYIRASRHGIFNFENVFVSYTRYIKTHEQQNNQVQSISRA